MNTRSTLAVRILLLLAVLLLLAPGFAQVKATQVVEGITLIGSDKGLQLKITGNVPLSADTQVLTGPDRIVVDFSGALPGKGLHGFAVKQAGVRAVRVGLFSSNPPTTRVVIDLERPMPYEMLPSGNSAFLKLGSAPAIVQASSKTPNYGGAIIHPPSAPPAPSPLQVSFTRGQLWVSARNASLAEVLYQVHLRTGADIPIPAGAEQERVVITAGPGPAKEVLATVLNGSRFNFVLVGSEQDQNQLRSVILTPKTDIGYQSAVSAPQPAPQPQPQMEQPTDASANQPPQPDPSQDIAPVQPDPPDGQAAGPVQPGPNQGQGQTIAPPSAPPPPPMQDENRPWTEPPPTTPQPEL